MAANAPVWAARRDEFEAVAEQQPTYGSDRIALTNPPTKTDDTQRSQQREAGDGPWFFTYFGESSDALAQSTGLAQSVFTMPSALHTDQLTNMTLFRRATDPDRAGPEYLPVSTMACEQ